MLHWLGVKPSYSRPRVSDDNAYAEALFRTAKYRPEFPAKGFTDLDAARAWAAFSPRCGTPSLLRWSRRSCSVSPAPVVTFGQPAETVMPRA